MNVWNARNAMSGNNKINKISVIPGRAKREPGIHGTVYAERSLHGFRIAMPALRFGMSSGMTKIFTAFYFLSVFVPSLAHAQGAAPGMFGVREIVVQYANFTNPKTADTCGLVREELAGILKKALTDSNVPAIAATDAKPPIMGVARIELVPEIASVNSQDLDCVSWVSLTAQSRSNVRVPPVDTLRSITVVYWRQGTMVASGQASHERLIGDLLKKMAQQFAQQYRIDQPPDIPASQ